MQMEISTQETRQNATPVAPELTSSVAETGTPLPQPQLQLEPLKGPLDKVYAFWLAGMSCDGCTVAVAGATSPPVESLLNGTLPGLPKVILSHPVLSVEVGEEFMRAFHQAWEGKLDAPYVVICEGSIADERIAAETGGLLVSDGVECDR